MASALPHLLLVNLGTPIAPTAPAVRDFLEEFLGDPAVVDFPRWFWAPILYGIVLRTRPARVAEQYHAIWSPDGSPLRVATERLVADVRRWGAGRFEVSAAYRYGEPSLDTAMERLAAEHRGQVVVAPLFPQRTEATTGTAFRRTREAAVRAGVAERVVERLLDPMDAGYVDAMVSTCRDALGRAGDPIDHLVVSFHGIPERYNRREGGQYVLDCQRTMTALVRGLGWPLERATLAYQSKFGPERWLEPSTADVLEALPGRGVRSVAVITPGFLTDGLETLEEIGIRGRDAYIAAGGERFVRIPSVEREPSFVQALGRLALLV